MSDLENIKKQLENLSKDDIEKIFSFICDKRIKDDRERLLLLKNKYKKQREEINQIFFLYKNTIIDLCFNYNIDGIDYEDFYEITKEKYKDPNEKILSLTQGSDFYIKTKKYFEEIEFKVAEIFRNSIEFEDFQFLCFNHLLGIFLVN